MLWSPGALSANSLLPGLLGLQSGGKFNERPVGSDCNSILQDISSKGFMACAGSISLSDVFPDLPGAVIVLLRTRFSRPSLGEVGITGIA